MFIDKIFTYTYRKNEFKKVIMYSKFQYMIFTLIFSIFMLTWIIIIFAIGTSPSKQIIYSLGCILLCIIIYMGSPYSFSLFNNYISYIKSEQKIYFKDAMMFCKSGDYIFKIDKRCIDKIIETKNFYKITLYIIKGSREFNEIFISPMIPKRSACRADIYELAKSLNVEFEDSFFYRIYLKWRVKFEKSKFWPSVILYYSLLFKIWS